MNIDIQYGYELIENIIQKINNQILIINYNSKEYIISLKECDNENKNDFYKKNYELRPSKKDLKPKNDISPFSSSILLKNIANDKISLICKNELYIMLIEKFDDYIKPQIEKKNENKDEKEKITKKKSFKKYDNFKYKSSCLII